MKRILPALFAVVIGLVASGTIQANPCVCPKRMVRGQTVDLQPLINWWREPKGARPLPAWKHVHGSIARDIPYGWVIVVRCEEDGQVEKFLLKNPPRDRLRRFQDLQQELVTCQKASAVANELVSRAVYTDYYSYWVTQSVGPAQNLAEYRQAEAMLSAINRRMVAIHDELAPMKDASGKFQLDAFAVKFDDSFEGLPVYDYGSTAPFGY